MSSRPARCGTESGYQRHRRILKEPACPACLAAHSAAERARRTYQAARYCDCGRQIRTDHTTCSLCRRSRARVTADQDPVWVRRGLIYVNDPKAGAA